MTRRSKVAGDRFRNILQRLFPERPIQLYLPLTVVQRAVQAVLIARADAALPVVVTDSAKLSLRRGKSGDEESVVLFGLGARFAKARI